MVADPTCRGVVLAGAAGTGKTRLASEVLAHAAASGLATERVIATTAASTLPFGALAVLLPAALTGETGALRSQMELMARSASALVERAAGRRLVLLVDDAHLLDDASAALIEQLAVTNSAFVLTTLRSGTVPPDPIVALWKEELVERVEVPALSTVAVEELLRRHLGGEISTSAVAALSRQAQGNMLFLTELVRAARENGVLHQEDRVWELEGRVHLSDRLIELVESRLRRLEPADRKALQLVAFGEPLGTSELERMVGDGALQRLEQQGVVRTQPDRRRLAVYMGHPMYGEVVRGGTPSAQARSIARRLAEATEATGARRRGDSLQVAAWRLQCGGGSAELMLAAARAAQERHDFPLAERLALAASDAGAGFEADLLAAVVAVVQGRRDVAEARLRAAEGAAGHDAALARVAIVRFEIAHFQLRTGESEAVLREALAVITDPLIRDEIEARLCWPLLATSGPGPAHAACERLLRRGIRGAALVMAALGETFALARMGQCQRALDLSEQAEAAHRSLPQARDDYLSPLTHAFPRCEALAGAGRLAQGEALAGSSYRQAVEVGALSDQGFFAYQLGSVLAERGRMLSAARYARESAVIYRRIGETYRLAEALLLLARVTALRGNSEEATEALAGFDALQLPGVWHYAGVFLARGWVAAAAGDLQSATRHLEEEVSVGLGREDLVPAAAALHSLVRLGAAKFALPRLVELAGRMEGDLITSRVAHARGILDREPSALDEVAHHFEALGADLLAAEAAADAAVAWRRAGSPRKATASEHRAGVLLERCEGATTPAVQAIGTRARMTLAERETALLAAKGSSNKEIAKVLCLSVRTVETRLQHVYEKLGISDRRELSRCLGRPG